MNTKLFLCFFGGFRATSIANLGARKCLGYFLVAVFLQCLPFLVEAETFGAEKGLEFQHGSANVGSSGNDQSNGIIAPVNIGGGDVAGSLVNGGPESGGGVGSIYELLAIDSQGMAKPLGEPLAGHGNKSSGTDAINPSFRIAKRIDKSEQLFWFLIGIFLVVWLAVDSFFISYNQSLEEVPYLSRPNEKIKRARTRAPLE